MAYRGDDDAQRARIEELEREVAKANAQVSELRGERASDTAGRLVETSRLSGGPSRYVREVTLPHAIDEEGYEAIARVLATRLRMNASQVGRTLSVPRTFSLARDGETTRIRLEADWSQLGLGVAATSVVAGLFSGSAWLGLTSDLLLHGFGGSGPYDAAQFVVATTLAFSLTVGSGAWMRRRTSRQAQQSLEERDGTFEAILAIADAHAVRTTPPTRVAEDESEAEELSPADASSRTSTR